MNYSSRALVIEHARRPTDCGSTMQARQIAKPSAHNSKYFQAPHPLRPPKGLPFSTDLLRSNFYFVKRTPAHGATTPQTKNPDAWCKVRRTHRLGKHWHWAAWLYPLAQEKGFI